MSELTKQITSYNLFNYLLPGAVFCAVAHYLFGYDLILDNLFAAFFFYYFIGLTISRIGSLIIEPAMKGANFTRFRPYTEYITASKKDPKIELLSEMNNVNRTLISLPICLGAYAAGIAIADGFKLSTEMRAVTLLVVITFVYGFSYSKQTGYISKRIEDAVK